MYVNLYTYVIIYVVLCVQDLSTYDIVENVRHILYDPFISIQSIHLYIYLLNRFGLAVK